MDHSLTEEELALLKERNDWLYWNWYTQPEPDETDGTP